MTYVNVIILLFLAGVIGGTILANCLNTELMEQSGYFGSLFLTQTAVNQNQRKQLFFYVLRQRSIEVIVAWLVSITMYSAFIFAGFSFLCGGSMGILISMITYQKGVWGIFYYLATIFPQIICYLPVWFVLAVWAGEKGKNYRFVSLVKILLLIFSGVCLETYINPLIIGQLIK